MAYRTRVSGSKTEREMKRWIICLLFLCLGAMPLMGQDHFYPSRPWDDAAHYEGPVFGIKGGLNIPRLYYTKATLSGLPHDLLLKPSASCFVELPLSRLFTIAPELNYQQRGGATTYRFNGLLEQYSLEAHYVSVRVPFYCYAPVSDRFKPYLFLGPDLGAPIMGKIQIQLDKVGVTNEVNINGSNINRLYVGAVGGAGFRVNMPLRRITLVLKLETALNLGLLDTYAPAEHDGTANPINVQVYTINDHRWSRGLEFHLGLGFFFNKYNACGTFQ